MIKKHSALFLTISTALAIACAVCLSCGTNIFGFHPMDKQAYWLSFLLFGLTTIFASISIFFGYRLKKYRPSVFLIALFSFLILFNLISLLLYKNPTVYGFVDPLNNSYTINHSINGMEIAIYELRFFGLLFNAFMILDFIPKFYKTNHVVRVVCWCVLTFGAVAIIASFFTDSMKYYYLLTFDNFFIRLHTLAIYSFFGSKNSFGTSMLLCLVSSIILFREKKNLWWLIALAISNIWLVLSQCKLGILAGLLIETAYFISLYVLTFSKDKKRSTIVGVSILGGVVVTVGLLFIIGPTREFVLKVFANLFAEANGMNTFETRQYMWSYTFNILSHSNYASGVGFGLFNDILYIFTSVDVENIAMYHTTTSHNAALQLLGDGGIILLISWLALLAYLVYVSIKVLKINKETAITTLVLIASMLVYGVFESSCLIFVSTGEFVVLTLLVVVPLMQVKQHSLDSKGDKILNLI